MPYASDKQRKWAHTESAKKAGFPTKKWDREEHEQNKRKALHMALKKGAGGK